MRGESNNAVKRFVSRIKTKKPEDLFLDLFKELDEQYEAIKQLYVAPKF